MSRRRRWDRIELQQFFAAFKTEGSQWSRIAEKLPGRTAGQVAALGKQHRALLASHGATADMLCDAVQDHYAKQAAARALKRASNKSDGGSVASDSSNKRRRTGGSIKSEATKRPRKAARSRRRKAAIPVAPVLTGSLRRKAAFATTDVDSLLEFSGPIAGIPASATAMQHRAHTLARCASTRLRLFCVAEWCYSAIDRGYFLRNEFKECLSEMRVPAVGKLCRAEWAAIRTVMGRPRRLSTTFLHEERGKLERYREDVRLVQQGRAPVNSLNDSPFVYQVPVPLAVGQHVTALHPLTRSLAMGCILTRDLGRGIYRVQFDRPELGVHRCLDTDIMPHGAVQLLYPALASQSASGSPVGFTPHDSWRLGIADVELEESADGALVGGGAADRSTETRTTQLKIMVQVQQLLDRKEALVQQLKTMNVEARALKGRYSESFRRGYTWLLMCLEATNRALDPVLQSMRRLRNVQGVATGGPDVAEKLQMLLGRCDEKAALIVRKNTMFSMSSADTDGDQIQAGSVLQLITSALSFLLAVKECSEHPLASWETWALLERGLNVLKPKFEANSDVFHRLETAVANLRRTWASK